jgi:hypothetical protein
MNFTQIRNLIMSVQTLAEYSAKITDAYLTLKARFDAQATAYETKLTEALAADAIADEQEIADKVAAQTAEVKTQLETLKAEQSTIQATEAATLADLTQKLTDAGVSLDTPTDTLAGA